VSVSTDGWPAPRSCPNGYSEVLHAFEPVRAAPEGYHPKINDAAHHQRHPRSTRAHDEYQGYQLRLPLRIEFASSTGKQRRRLNACPPGDAGGRNAGGTRGKHQHFPLHLAQHGFPCSVSHATIDPQPSVQPRYTRAANATAGWRDKDAPRHGVHLIRAKGHS
jgi:hypothetical protein